MDAKTLGDKPAFPVFPETGTGHGAAFRGVTKRELFAAMAMQGFISHISGPTIIGRFEPCEVHAIAAVNYADALLAQLAKDQP